MSELRVRAATPGDADAITAIHVEGRRWGYRGFVPDALLEGDAVREERRARWDGWLREPAWRSRTFVAELEGVPAGVVCVGGDRAIDEAGVTYTLCVRSETIAGRGVGRALMSAGLRALARMGFTTATLWVLTANARARRFYERSGFVADGAEKIEVVRGVPLPSVRYRVERIAEHGG